MTRNNAIRLNAMYDRLQALGVSYEHADTLRRIAMTLHRWHELECGTDAGVIERDQSTGIPYWYNSRARYVQANDPRCYTRIPDRESGTLKRLAATMANYPDLAYYVQTDPRGLPLYIGRREDMNEATYNNGVGVGK